MFVPWTGVMLFLNLVPESSERQESCDVQKVHKTCLTIAHSFAALKMPLSIYLATICNNPSRQLKFLEHIRCSVNDWEGE